MTTETQRKATVEDLVAEIRQMRSESVQELRWLNQNVAKQLPGIATIKAADARSKGYAAGAVVCFFIAGGSMFIGQALLSGVAILFAISLFCHSYAQRSF